MSADLEAQVALAELEFARIALAEDLRAGRVPDDARRGLYAHEVASRVDFVALSAEVEAFVAELLSLLGAQRARFLALLRADLAATGSTEALLGRLSERQSLGIRSVPGAPELLEQARGDLAPVVARLAREGATRAVAEAGAQGVILPSPILPDRVMDGVSRHVDRLVTNPNTDALRAVYETSFRLDAGAPVDRALGLVDETGRALSAGPLEDLSRQASYAANALGRQAAAGPRARIYASELLDNNTCGWCRRNDGREYASTAEATADYPLGAYRLCDGGLRCRGTLVYVYDESTP